MIHLLKHFCDWHPYVIFILYADTVPPRRYVIDPHQFDNCAVYSNDFDFTGNSEALLRSQYIFLSLMLNYFDLIIMCPFYVRRCWSYVWKYWILFSCWIGPLRSTNAHTVINLICTDLIIILSCQAHFYRLLKQACNFSDVATGLLSRAKYCIINKYHGLHKTWKNMKYMYKKVKGMYWAV